MIIWSLSGIVTYLDGTTDYVEVRSDNYSGNYSSGPDVSQFPEIVELVNQIGLTPKSSSPDPNVTDFTYRFSVLLENGSLYTLGDTEAMVIETDNLSLIREALGANSNFSPFLADSGDDGPEEEGVAPLYWQARSRSAPLFPMVAADDGFKFDDAIFINDEVEEDVGAIRLFMHGTALYRFVVGETMDFAKLQEIDKTTFEVVSTIVLPLMSGSYINPIDICSDGTSFYITHNFSGSIYISRFNSSGVVQDDVNYGNLYNETFGASPVGSVYYGAENKIVMLTSDGILHLLDGVGGEVETGGWPKSLGGGFYASFNNHNDELYCMTINGGIRYLHQINVGAGTKSAGTAVTTTWPSRFAINSDKLFFAVGTNLQSIARSGLTVDNGTTSYNQNTSFEYPLTTYDATEEKFYSIGVTLIEGASVLVLRVTSKTGTRLSEDVVSNFTPSVPRSLVKFGNYLYFNDDNAFVKIDGTTATLISDNNEIQSLVVHNGILYGASLTAINVLDVDTGEFGSELVSLDRTISSMASYGGELYLGDGESIYQLIDGTLNDVDTNGKADGRLLRGPTGAILDDDHVAGARSDDHDPMLYYYDAEGSLTVYLTYSMFPIAPTVSNLVFQSSLNFGEWESWPSYTVESDYINLGSTPGDMRYRRLRVRYVDADDTSKWTYIRED